MLASSDGLYKDMEVTATGAGISVPVGKETLGRLFNVLGETIDNGEQLDNTNCAILNDYPTDDLNNLIQALMQQIIVVYANKAQTLGM